MKIQFQMVAVLAALTLVFVMPGCGGDSNNDTTTSTTATDGTDSSASTGDSVDGGDDTATGTDAGDDTATGTDAGDDTATGTDAGDDTGTGTDTGTDDGSGATSVGTTDGTIDCEEGIVCEIAAPECDAPLIPVNDGNGCYACGYPETCTCNDGEPAMCDMEPPVCEKGAILATQGGCYSCVDPMTCQAPVPPTTDKCTSAEDCTTSPYEFPVNSMDDCYCPMCPDFPMTMGEHKKRQDAWMKTCSEWAAKEPCPDVSCVGGGPDVVCEQGQCAFDSSPTNKCEEGVTCKKMTPECPPPLVPTNDGNGCWACGYPDTCNCDDGNPNVCDMVPPKCPEGTMLAQQNGCFECVDPMTCKVPGTPPEEQCNSNEDCFISPFEKLVTSTEDCFCVMCPFWAMTQAEHVKREQAWSNYCSEWALTEPCPMPKCSDPGPPLCDMGMCYKEDEMQKDCAAGVQCKMLPPACDPPLIPVNDGTGCWACGYPKTCNCDDGGILMCKMAEPKCDKDEQLAIQDGCYLCVDPQTCKPPKDKSTDAVPAGKG